MNGTPSEQNPTVVQAMGVFPDDFPRLINNAQSATRNVVAYSCLPDFLVTKIGQNPPQFAMS